MMKNRIKVTNDLFIERKDNDSRTDEQIIKSWLQKKHNSKLSIECKLKNQKFAVNCLTK